MREVEIKKEKKEGGGGGKLSDYLLVDVKNVLYSREKCISCIRERSNVKEDR